MENVDTYYGHLVHLMALWYILWPFGNLCSRNLVLFFTVLVYFIKKNLATLSVCNKFLLSQR
jgi:hypothetical protein